MSSRYFYNLNSKTKISSKEINIAKTARDDFTTKFTSFIIDNFCCRSLKTSLENIAVLKLKGPNYFCVWSKQLAYIILKFKKGHVASILYKRYDRNTFDSDRRKAIDPHSHLDFGNRQTLTYIYIYIHFCSI